MAQTRMVWSIGSNGIRTKTLGLWIDVVAHDAADVVNGEILNSEII